MDLDLQTGNLLQAFIGAESVFDFKIVFSKVSKYPPPT